MISCLRGVLLEKRPPFAVIEVQGVGYEVEVPMSTFFLLPELNTEVKLLTHLNIREDTHVLYGFMSDSERRLFRLLLKVNGVGPKLALSILSTMELTTFVHHVRKRDSMPLTRIPGVGKKTAERLVMELSDRLDSLLTDAPTSTPPTQPITSAADDAVSALVALGYRPQEATRWVNAVAQEGFSSETLIRQALRIAMGS